MSDVVDDTVAFGRIKAGPDESAVLAADGDNGVYACGVCELDTESADGCACTINDERPTLLGFLDVRLGTLCNLIPRSGESELAEDGNNSSVRC